MLLAMLMLIILVAGGASGATLLTLTPENQNQSFGRSAACLGDINGDSHDDFVILDNRQRGTDYSGRAYVYFGGPDVDAQPDLILQQNDSGELRTSLVGPIDFNGDGYGDIVLGAPNYDWEDMTNCGAVFVYYGGPNLDATADLVIPGPWTNYRFGSVLANAGHFDSEDEYDDLVATIATTYGWGPSPTAYVFRGGPQPATEAYWGRSNSSYFNGFGSSIAYAGDRNGDGRGDLVFGIPWLSGIWYHDETVEIVENVGNVYLVHGGELRHGSESYWDMLTGTAELGASVDGNFDFNGDGLDDVIAAAPYIQESRIIFGNTDPSNFQSMALVPGKSVAGLGDVNADGFDDVAIVDISGMIYVFWGGTIPDAVPDWIIDPEPGVDLSTVRVWRAGDVDSDGRDDVLVTVSWYTGSGYHQEAGHVFSWTGPVSAVPEVASTTVPLSYQGAVPNPFNPRTRLSYRVEQDTRVQVRLFDLRGHLIRTLLDDMVTSGDHMIEWDGRDDRGGAVASGTYTVQVLGLGRSVGGTLTLVR